MRSLRSVVLLWMFFAGFPCSAQQKAVLSARAAEELVDPHPIEESAMRFDKTELAIPPISEDDAPVQVAFRFVNGSKSPLVITRVVAGCGCIAADYHKAPIPAGDGGTIRVTFSPSGHPGELLRKVFVYTNLSSQFPSARLILTGKVSPTSDRWRSYPHRLGELRTRRREVTFRTDRKTTTVECIACVNTGEQPLRLRVSEQSAPYLCLSTTPETLRPGEEGDLVLTLDSARIPAGLPDTVRIPMTIDGPTTPPAERTLFITIINR